MHQENKQHGDTLAGRLARWVSACGTKTCRRRWCARRSAACWTRSACRSGARRCPGYSPSTAMSVPRAGNRKRPSRYHGDRLSAPYAAYANSMFSYSCELQHHGSFGSAHTGVIVVPVVQALAEKLGSSGRDIIAAMVAGYEVQGRLGAALFKAVLKRHFHPQGCSASSAPRPRRASCWDSTEEQQAHAFAIAGSHASSILEYDQAGGEVKRIHGAIGAAQRHAVGVPGERRADRAAHACSRDTAASSRPSAAGKSTAERPLSPASGSRLLHHALAAFASIPPSVPAMRRSTSSTI